MISKLSYDQGKRQIRKWSVRQPPLTQADNLRKITEEVQKFFIENPNENVYVGVFGLGANGKVNGKVR